MGLWPQSWPTGGPGTGLEDKELRAADTQSGTAVLCSLSTRSNVTHLQSPPLPPPSHTPLTSEHEPTHRGSNYPFPRWRWPWVLDPQATVLRALLTLFSLVSERGRVGAWGKTGTQSKKKKKNGSACLRSLPSRLLLKACLSITGIHTEAGCSWGKTAGSRKSRRLHKPFLFSFDTNWALGPDLS